MEEFKVRSNKTWWALLLLGLLVFMAGCGQIQTPPGERAGSSKSLQQPAQQSLPSEQARNLESGQKPPDPKAATSPAENQPTNSSDSSGNGKLPEVRLVVSRDYGKTVIVDKSVAIASREDSVLDLTARTLPVATAYGGGYVQSIAGVSSATSGKGISQQRQDWFFYLNGTLPARGSGDVKPGAGDVIWWDYHPWGSGFNSTMLGAFPRPFHNGALLLYTPGTGEEAATLAGVLQQKGGQANLQVLDQSRKAKPGQPAIVIGLWQELQEVSFIRDLVENRQRTGLFCLPSGSGFQALDSSYQPVGPVLKNGAACILPVGAGLGDNQPLLLIIGEDNQGLQQAIDFLGGKDIPPRYAWGVLLDGTHTCALPGQ